MPDERPGVGPIIVPGGNSAAEACHPDDTLEDGPYHIYESNPAPWWIALLWASFLVFGVIYLFLNLLD